MNIRTHLRGFRIDAAEELAPENVLQAHLAPLFFVDRIHHGSKSKVEEVQLLYKRIRFRDIGRADIYFELAYIVKVCTPWLQRA